MLIMVQLEYVQIYGIDAASGAAVQALGIADGDHVLDLCAAPGNNQELLPSLFFTWAFFCIPLIFFSQYFHYWIVDIMSIKNLLYLVILEIILENYG